MPAAIGNSAKTA